MRSEFIDFRPWEHMNLSRENIEHKIESEHRAYNRISKLKPITKKQEVWYCILLCEINERIELYTKLLNIKRKFKG